jgi:putative acetyltransferase
MNQNKSDIDIVAVSSPDHIRVVKELFIEYARSLDFNLCFQNFEKELAKLPGEYSPPGGILLLAMNEHHPAGCIALRRIDDATCEMKRLYIKPEARGSGYGRTLTVELLRRASALGYRTMRLDTVPSMKEAIELYTSLGFKKIPPYRENPVEGAIFMELDLTTGRNVL